MFLRRLFYDGVTGAALYTYEMQGSFTPVDVLADPNRPEGDNVQHMDWLVPDYEVEQKFNEQRTLTVNVETQELIWGEPGSALPPMPPSEEDELTDAVAALETLGYTEEENG